MQAMDKDEMELRLLLLEAEFRWLAIVLRSYVSGGEPLTDELTNRELLMKCLTEIEHRISKPHDALLLPPTEIPEKLQKYLKEAHTKNDWFKLSSIIKKDAKEYTGIYREMAQILKKLGFETKTIRGVTHYKKKEAVHK
jgi:hypothetical protein